MMEIDSEAEDKPVHCRSGPDFLAVLYAVESLRKLIAQGDLQKICRLQRVCKDSCWQAMIDRAAMDATALNFTDCPARYASKPKSPDQLLIWLQTRINPRRITRVIFGPIDEQFHQGFCAVVVQCCPNIQQLKFGVVGSAVPLKQEFAGMPRLMSLHIDVLPVDDDSWAREESLSDDLLKIPLLPNLLALTFRNRNLISFYSIGWAARSLHTLVQRCPNLKYVHVEGEDRCVDFNQFRYMQQLDVLRLHCAYSYDFDEDRIKTPKLRCLEFGLSPPYRPMVTPILFHTFQNSTDHLETLSLAFVNIGKDVRETFSDAAEYLTALKHVKIAIASDMSEDSMANCNALMLIFAANPHIEWLVLKGMKLPLDFTSECVRSCMNLRFVCISFPGDFIVEQANLVKADLQSLLNSRNCTTELTLRICLPNFTYELLCETGLKELFHGRNDVKFENIPNPEWLEIQQFIEEEYFRIF